MHSRRAAASHPARGPNRRHAIRNAKIDARPAEDRVDRVAHDIDVRGDDLLGGDRDEFDEAAVDARVPEADVDVGDRSMAEVVVPDLLAVSLKRPLVPGGAEAWRQRHEGHEQRDGSAVADETAAQDVRCSRHLEYHARMECVKL